MRPNKWDEAANRLCTGHRAGRPQIKIDCPKCCITIDTEASTWIDCPDCACTFNRHNGTVLQDILTPIDKEQ